VSRLTSESLGADSVPAQLQINWPRLRDWQNTQRPCKKLGRFTM